MAPEARRNRCAEVCEVFRRNERPRRGKTFCQVERRAHIGQESPDMTPGNQRCVGAAPSLVIRPIKSSHFGPRLSLLSDHKPPRSNVNAPSVWARRYFVADSCSWAELF